MMFWVIRYPNGTYQGSPLSPLNRTTNINLAATWRQGEEAEGRAQILKGVAVPFNYREGRMTEIK